MNGGGEGFVFFRGHGAEESFLPPSLREVPRRGGGSVVLTVENSPSHGFCRASPLNEGAKVVFPGLKLHLGTVGLLVQRSQYAVMDAVKDRLFRQKLYFRLGRMHIYIHRIGRQCQMQHTSGELAHHDLVPVGFLQCGDQQPGFYRAVIDEKGL